MLRHSILLDEDMIAARVGELAEAIWRDLPDDPPIMVGLLSGGFVFLADLMRALSRRGVEPWVDFIAASHYGAGTESSGEVYMLKDISLDVRDRPVLIVDDILDSGHTLKLVRNCIAARGPAWLKICVLLDKPMRREMAIEADYVGFDVPDVWVIGYGLDAGGEGRALPYVAVLGQENGEKP